MRIPIIALALVILGQGVGEAASRTWKSRKGVEVKAEFTGVLNGKVILKLPGGVRQPVRLSDFSLEDRDYLVEQLTKRNRLTDMKQLRDLMTAENAVPAIDPDALRTQVSNDGSDAEYAESDTALNPLPGRPLNPNLPGQMPEAETEMYGLPLPSLPLLVEDPVRSWTSLTGDKQLAKFDRVLAPGFLRLKKADGTTGNFAIVNFSKEDIDYVKQTLQKDMARSVFPEGSGFQSLTPDDVSKGYRVWTDRKKVSLVGKFVGVKGDDVVIEVQGENKEYPMAGLSEADHTWVKDEVRRRAEEAAARAAESRASRDPGGSGGRFPFGQSRFGGGHSDSGNDNSFADSGSHGESSNPFGMRNGSRFGPRSSMFPQYEFTCEHCGKQWTESSPISQCPDCKGKSFFRCHRCGHEWSRTDGGLIDQCPRCANGGADPVTSSDSSAHSSPSSYSSPSSSEASPTSSPSSLAATSAPKEGQGVVMTIIYVVAGLGLLGAIAAGLIRSFG